MCVLELNKLFRVSSLAVLGTGVIVGEDGAVIDLIDKEKVSLPVLMKSSTEVRSKSLHVIVACTFKADSNSGLA